MKGNPALTTRRNIMVDSLKSYAGRVVRNDAFKRGAAGAAAGIIVAGIIEAAWPTLSE